MEGGAARDDPRCWRTTPLFAKAQGGQLTGLSQDLGFAVSRTKGQGVLRGASSRAVQSHMEAS